MGLVVHDFTSQRSIDEALRAIRCGMLFHASALACDIISPAADPADAVLKWNAHHCALWELIDLAVKVLEAPADTIAAALESVPKNR